MMSSYEYHTGLVIVFTDVGLACIDGDSLYGAIDATWEACGG